MVALEAAWGGFFHETGQNVEGLKAYEEAVRVGEAAAARHGPDPALLEQLLRAYDSMVATYEAQPDGDAARRPLPGRGRAARRRPAR